MQTQIEQELSNNARLIAYRAKQTEEQRRSAEIAKRVDTYCKNLNLNLLQRSVAIRMALKQLEFGCSEINACKTGETAALIIALANAGQTTGGIIRRNISVLH